MKVAANTREEYLAMAGEREPSLLAVDHVVREAAPQLEPVYYKTDTMTMLGYGLVPYQSKSMKQPAQWPIVALANQKNYMALYISAVDPDGQYVAEKNAGRLGKVSCGRSCIRFKKLEDINLDVVRELVADVARRHAAGEKFFGV